MAQGIVNARARGCAPLPLFWRQWGRRFLFDVMFQEFSWGQFLLFSALLSFLWYLLVALLCYRAELDAFLKGKASSSGPPFGNPLLREPGAGPVGSAGQGESMQGSEETLMGASRLP